jgi:hypothetical protein
MQQSLVAEPVASETLLGNAICFKYLQYAPLPQGKIEAADR